MTWEAGHLVLDDLETLLARYVAFPSDHARDLTNRYGPEPTK